MSIKPHLDTWSGGLKKRFEIMTARRRDVMLRKLLVDWTRENIILSTDMWGVCFTEPDMFSVFESCFGVFGGGTHLAMPKTICAPDTSSLKPGSGATEGVLD